MAGVARKLPVSSGAADVGVTSANAHVVPAIPDRFFERRMFANGLLKLPGGNSLPYWGFEDPIHATGRKPFPSPVIRLRESETAQIRLDMLKPASSGGGREAPHATTGLRVAAFDTHIYQWLPQSSGTWLYQNHKSTPHDFEMGLFGMLIVDPKPDVLGRPLAYKNGPHYTLEKLWIIDDADLLWHTAAAETAQPAAFNPQYFLLNGVANVEAAHRPDSAITASAGDKVLIRILNASFSLVKITVEHFQGNIVSVDGAAIDTSASPWTSWIPLQPDRPLFMATGSRHDLLIDLDPDKNAAVPGKPYKVTIEFLDLTRRTIRNAHSSDPLHVGRLETTITVN